MKRKSFCILGQNVKVIYSSKPLVDQTGRPLAGYFDIDKNTIMVGHIGEKEDYKTLIHELGHALVFRSGLAQIISLEAQEILCEALSHFIYENFDMRKSKRKT